jgi:hypothetical protein
VTEAKHKKEVGIPNFHPELHHYWSLFAIKNQNLSLNILKIYFLNVIKNPLLLNLKKCLNCLAIQIVA